MHPFVVSLLLVFGLAACIDRVELPIRAEEPRLVIDGQFTNEAPPYTIRLTYTSPFGLSSDQRPALRVVSGAQVSLADGQGHSVRFIDQGGGTYRTIDSTFRGQVGQPYSLTVLLTDGKRYVTKPEQMPAIPPIDSISPRLIQANNVQTPYRYSYSITTHDPASQRNFYRWTAYGLTVRKSTGEPCCFGCLAICFDVCFTTESSTQVNVFSDAAINGNPIRNRAVIQVPVYAAWPQFVEVQQYGITQANYQFWKLYEQQRARTGSIFDPLPAPVTGNLVNAADPTDVARGYFAITSITRRRVRNEALEARSSSAVYGFVNSQLVPQGDCRNTYGRVPVVEPPGW
ncbi:MAG: hypothetical protein JWP57_3056 [Spirosoma sp.]|nr:hypothetical protein [Spirosoma sp.]